MFIGVSANALIITKTSTTDYKNRKLYIPSIELDLTTLFLCRLRNTNRHQTSVNCKNHLRVDFGQIFGQRVDAGPNFSRHAKSVFCIAKFFLKITKIGILNNL